MIKEQIIKENPQTPLQLNTVYRKPQIFTSNQNKGFYTQKKNSPKTPLIKTQDLLNHIIQKKQHHNPHTHHHARKKH